MDSDLTFVVQRQTWLHPMVRDTTAVLISLHRCATSEFTSYANWLGLVN